MFLAVECASIYKIVGVEVKRQKLHNLVKIPLSAYMLLCRSLPATIVSVTGMLVKRADASYDIIYMVLPSVLKVMQSLAN